MNYVACQNEECTNFGAPYLLSDQAVLNCPLCGNAMGAVTPDLEPQETASNEPFAGDDVETKRSVKASAIRTALVASDIWAARHVEDGVSLTPERIAYRQALRALLDGVATSSDPQGIEIPDLPPPPTS